MSNDVQARRNELLKIIVKEYIATAVPVASEAVIKHHKLNVSSATIRNDMMALEQEGYISRPHTSAGCIPLDKGYRFYVQTLSQNLSLNPEEQSLVKDSFQSTEEEIDQWLKLSAMLISKFAGNAALVTFPKASKNRFKHVELVALHDFLALLILVLGETSLKQQFLTFKTPVTQDELTALANKLNSVYTGLASSDIRTKKITYSVIETRVSDIILDIMSTEDDIDYTQLYLEGLRLIASQPEFTKRENMLRIIELLETRKDWLIQMISRKKPANKIQIFIGEESQFEEFKDLSLVLGNYGIPKKMSGTIGVIGPTRMDYRRAISAVGYISDMLSLLLADGYIEN
jgi:heat-inducible transcriptional repressor